MSRFVRHLRRPRAFSLIEILIAVVVLALGLLGLGMVFPVVVRQQRQAQDTIQGLSAARSAAEYIQARRDLVTALIDVGKEWYTKDGHSQSGSVDLHDGNWLVDLDNVGGGTTFTISHNNGLVTVGQTSAPKFIGLGDRLSPAPFTPGSNPQFVWDFALRVPAPGQVQIAVFTRRIDAGIRVPAGTVSGTIKQYTLSHVLTGEPNVAQAYKRAPVAVDKDGRPTLTGLNQNGDIKNAYSVLRTIDPATQDPKTPNVLVLNATDPVLLGQARQPGQKLVDNYGFVHTVVRAAENTSNAVILEKPLNDVQLDEIATGQMQFLLTPQVPAAVEVITLRE